MSVLRTHTVLVDSRDRNYETYPSPSSYRVFLPCTLKNVVSARLVEAEVPASFYVFTEARNTTKLDVVLSSAADVFIAQQIVTIPDGNYTSSQMQEVLKKCLATAFGDVYEFTVTISPTTSKMNLKCTAVADPTEEIKIQLLFDDTSELFYPSPSSMQTSNSGWGLGYYLGFQRGSAPLGDATEGLTSPRPVFLNPVSNLELHIAEFVSDSVLAGGTDGTEQSRYNVFAKVPMPVNSGEVAFLDAGKSVPKVEEFHPPIARLDRITVSWRFHDADNTLVDFQDIDHSFALELVTRPLTAGLVPHHHHK